MKTYKLFIILITSTVLFGACRKDTPELTNPNEELNLVLPSQVFESFWHGMNNSYAFWSIDPTDWDQIYDEYLPRFQALDKKEAIDNEILKKMYTEITSNLIDHHYQIIIINNQIPEGESNQILIQPGMEEIKNRDYFHQPMTLDDLMIPITKNKEKGRIQRFAGGESSIDGGNKMTAYSYNIDNGVAYIYLSNFLLSAVMDQPENPNNSVMQALKNFQDMVLRMSDLKGVIIDSRNNGGGYLNDIHHILATMLDKDLHIGYTRNKNGMGRYDYTPWIPCVLSPAKEHRKIEVPIISLVDLYSISMAEMTPMAISALPNGYIIGERTFGATGPLNNIHSSTYGGQFKNGSLFVYTSTMQMKSVSGEIFEGRGVIPDIKVAFDEESMKRGIDTPLERALQLIREKNSN